MMFILLNHNNRKHTSNIVHITFTLYDVICTHMYYIDKATYVDDYISIIFTNIPLTWPIASVTSHDRLPFRLGLGGQIIFVYVHAVCHDIDVLYYIVNRSTPGAYSC